MESLLHWSISNTSPSSLSDPTAAQAAHDRITSLDPALIDAVLGVPDAVKMKQAMALAQDTGRSVEERVQALDDLELLVESIDNANDLVKLHLWEPLLALMQEEEEDLQHAAIWIAGTAVQNNPSAQSDFLSLTPDPIPLLLKVLGSEGKRGRTRSRAVYALSGAVNHNAAAVDRLASAGGWPVLRDALTDPDITVRRKVAFLLNTLLLLDGPAAASSSGTSSATGIAPHVRPQKEFSTTTTEGRTRQAFREQGVLDVLIKSIHPASVVPHGLDGDASGDIDFEEKVGRCLATYLEGTEEGKEREAWTEEQKSLLRDVLREHEEERLGLDEPEWERLRGSVQQPR